MVEYTPEWYEKEVKKCFIWKWFFIVAAVFLIIISPFYLIKTYPTIGITENNAKKITTQITDLRELIDEESQYPYYEFKTTEGETYYVDWKSYRDVMPYITAYGYEDREFSFMVERNDNVIQMEVEGRDEPLIEFEEGYNRMNSQHMIEAAPGLFALILAGYCIFRFVNKSKQYKKYLEEKEKAEVEAEAEAEAKK